MTHDYVQTEAFRGARFCEADLAGARFRDCNLTDVRIVSSVVTGLRVSGFGGGAESVVVDDVDVSSFVASELDRRHPERVVVRETRTSDDFRSAWIALDDLWTATVARAALLSPGLRDERVDDEWSFVETLRHLLFATDVWIDRMVHGGRGPFHPLGLPPSDYPKDRVAEMGIDLGSEAPYEEVVAAFADSRARVRAAVASVTDSDLEDVRTGVPAPAWGEESLPLGECLRVVLREHCEHRRFAVRDLAVLEAR